MSSTATTSNATAAAPVLSGQVLAFPRRSRLPLLPYPAGTYPAGLRTATLALMAGGIVALLGLGMATRQMSAITATVGHNAVPSIVAAQRIEASVARLNTSAIESVLASDHNGQESWGQVETERLTTNDVLLTAAQNITYGKFAYQGISYQPERESVFQIEKGLQDYLIAANVVHAQGTSSPEALWAASEAMRDRVLRSARQLGGNNYAHLDEDYSGHWFAAMFGFLGISAIALLAMLEPMRRIRAETGSYSGRAAAGQAIILTLAASTGFILMSDVARLGHAKSDAFDSINVLSRADALESDVGSQVALWLLLPARRQEIDERLKGDAREMSAPATPDDKGGMLTQELANITFAGEKEAAQATLMDWSALVSVVRNLRSLAQDGQTKQAADVLLSNRPGGYSLASSTFEGHLLQTMQINMEQFLAFIAGIDATLPLLEWAVPLFGLLGLALIWSGGMSRERLYS